MSEPRALASGGPARRQAQEPTAAGGQGKSLALEIRSMSQIYRSQAKGSSFTALQDVSLSASVGEFVSVVGPTGCGKSTLLSAISGLRAPSVGDVRVMGEPVAQPYLFEDVGGALA